MQNDRSNWYTDTMESITSTNNNEATIMNQAFFNLAIDELLDEDMDLVQSISKLLNKDINDIKVCTTEDETGFYEQLIDQIENDNPIKIPDLFGKASKATLHNSPVILTNEGGLGTIWM